MIDQLTLTRSTGTVAGAARGPTCFKIVLVASECRPFAQDGGLADVVAGLAKALRALGHDVRIVLPLYSAVDRIGHGLVFQNACCVHMGGGAEQWCGVHSATLGDSVPVWFVDCEKFFGRPGIYHDEWEYADNAFRFGFLSRAALQICKDDDFVPDVFHVHDWPTALVAAFLRTWEKTGPLAGAASVLTIHNIGHQGVYGAEAWDYLGLGSEYFTPDIFENYGRINLLKGGIWFADTITTVSPTHAREIIEPVGGHGMAPFLKQREADLVGILNGADYEHWNPATDPHIAARYSPGDLRGKAACKVALQRRFGLEKDPDVPLFGLVSRLAPQKGFGLLAEALPRAFHELRFQLVILGTGENETEEFVRWLASTRAGRVGCHVGFDTALSHQIQAGSDFFLMPSLYEPCGLGQMHAMKYGTLPVVRATGGLEDSVRDYDPATGGGTGFKFKEPTAGALFDALQRAATTWFEHRDAIEQLRAAAMAQDFSWARAAGEYVKAYQHAMGRQGAAGMKSSHHQAPSSKETPNIKLQSVHAAP